MIVFGHYSIPTRTLQPHEVPPSIKLEGDAKIQSIVRVVQIMWIPVFPFQSSWTLKQGGKRYVLNPEVSNMLDQLYERSKTPWYSFSLLILLVLAPMIYSVYNYFASQSSKKQYAEQIEKQRQDMLASIAAPTENDYYTFEMQGNYNKTVFKVQAFEQDSVAFQAPADREKAEYFYSDDKKVSFYMNPASVLTTFKLAKSDLEKAVRNSTENGEFPGEGPITAAFYGNKVRLEAIDRIDPEKIEVSYKDEKSEPEVRKAIRAWLSASQNIDSSMMLMDTASTNYFKNMLKVAQKGTFEEKKKFVESSEFPLSTYRYMLFTEYTYLSGSKPSSNLKDYAFFLKLLDEGLWTLDFETKIAAVTAIVEVKFSSPQTAKLVLRAPSNKLERKEDISFNATCHKENGKWRVNVPSTMSYSTYQIRKGMPFGPDQNKKYRQMVIDEVNKMESKSKNKVAAEWAW